MNIPGFKHLHKASSPDAVVVKVPTEGLLGTFGKKREFVVTRENCTDQIVEIMGNIPMWALERGLWGEIESELDRWRWPSLYRD